MHHSKLCRLVPYIVLLAPCTLHAAEPLLLPVSAFNPKAQNTIVVETGDEAVYKAGHIPGSVYLSLEEYAPAGNAAPPKADGTASEALRAELPSPDVLRNRLEEIGISDNTHIVVVWDENKNLDRATRLMLTLQYVGLSDQSSLLDGGLPEWKNEGSPLTTEVPAPARGSLKPRPTEKVTVDYAFVKQIPEKQAVVLVDARAKEFYDGEKPSFNVSGHLPGAVDVPTTELLNGHNTVDVENMKAKFLAAGITPQDTVVTYCNSGMQASVPYFAARLLGQKTLLYDGSIQDWSLNARGPVVKAMTDKEAK